MSAKAWKTNMAEQLDIKCAACRLEQSFSILDLRAVGGVGYLECPGCHYFNYIEDIKEKLNG
jgi:phage FluMu protein Com